MEINKVYNCDNVEGLSKLDDESIDLVVTSPPYDNLRQYHGFSFDLEGLIKELWRTLKGGGVIVWVVGDATINGSETGTSFRQALAFMDKGFNLFDTMIYEKPPQGAVGNNNGYWQTFEYMFVFSKGNPKNINLIKDRPNSYTSDGKKTTKRLPNGEFKHIYCKPYGEYGRRTNIWRYATGRGHSTKYQEAYRLPAIFAEALAYDHIISWSNEGDLVCDPFLGSGTTAVMAIRAKRNFIGFELSEEYCDIATKRIEIEQQQLTLF